MQTDSRETTDPATATKDEAANAIGELKESLQDCCGRIRDSVERKSQEVSETAVHSVGRYIDIYGNSLQAAADSLEEQGVEAAARFTRQASNRLKGMAESIERTTPREAMDYASEQVRLHPAAAIGCALAAGFLSARLLGARSETYEPETEEHAATTTL